MDVVRAPRQCNIIIMGKPDLKWPSIWKESMEELTQVLQKTCTKKIMWKTLPRVKSKVVFFLWVFHWKLARLVDNSSLVGWFHFFEFSPLLGEMIQFDEYLFQMGWNLKPPTSSCCTRSSFTQSVRRLRVFRRSQYNFLQHCPMVKIHGKQNNLIRYIWGRYQAMNYVFPPT